MRVGYLGPEGTFTDEVLRAAAGEGPQAIPLATIYETVMAVHERTVEIALVPIENSLEGSVDVTLDALAGEASDVAIVGETVSPIHHCLIAPSDLEPAAIKTLVSHPQATAQCAHFIRTALPAARVVTTSSTAEAVRALTEDRQRPWAALGNRRSAALYGCTVLRDRVEDMADNQTRFVWLATRERADGSPLAWLRGRGDPDRDPRQRDPCKTSIVFWGAGSEAPGWLVRCLSAFATRDVNLTRIESRPRRQGLGRYMFFADLEGSEREDSAVAEAIAELRTHCEEVRLLGSYPVT